MMFRPRKLQIGGEYEEDNKFNPTPINLRPQPSYGFVGPMQPTTPNYGPMGPFNYDNSPGLKDDCTESGMVWSEEDQRCVYPNGYDPTQEQEKNKPKGRGIDGMGTPKTGPGTGVNPQDPVKKQQSKIDPYFALRGATTGLSWLSEMVDRNRQNQYATDQYSTLGQIDPMPVSNFQPNRYNLYAQKGGVKNSTVDVNPDTLYLPKGQILSYYRDRGANRLDASTNREFIPGENEATSFMRNWLSSAGALKRMNKLVKDPKLAKQNIDNALTNVNNTILYSDTNNLSPYRPSKFEREYNLNKEDFTKLYESNDIASALKLNSIQNNIDYLGSKLKGKGSVTKGFHSPIGQVVNITQEYIDDNLYDTKDKAATVAHELTHASALDDFMKQYTPKSSYDNLTPLKYSPALKFLNKKTQNKLIQEAAKYRDNKQQDKEYITNDGMYPRIMEMRIRSNVNPNEVITPERYEQIKKENSNNQLYRYYDDKTIQWMLNNFVKNDSKNLLPTAQKGGKLAPITVDTPNDPRLKAYNDSLNLYKASEENRQWLLSNPNIKKPIYNSAYPALSINGKIQPTGSYEGDVVNTVGVNVNKYAFNKYKKPVQPVVYKKPEVNNVKTLPNINIQNNKYSDSLTLYRTKTSLPVSSNDPYIQREINDIIKNNRLYGSDLFDNPKNRAAAKRISPTGDEYDVKPIWTKVGDRYIQTFKKPIGVQEQKDYPIVTRPKAQVKGKITPAQPTRDTSQDGTPIYGPANSTIGYWNNGEFSPYTGVNQRGTVNNPDTELMQNSEALKKYLRGKGLNFKKGGLTPNKARQILHDGTVHGEPITEKQRRFFGAKSKGHTNFRK